MQKPEFLDTVLGLISLAFSIGVSLFYDQLPDQYKTVGIVVIIISTAIFIILVLFYLYRVRIQHTVAKVLTGYKLNVDEGVIYKGNLRNVAVRLETFHKTLEYFVRACPDTYEDTLRAAGKAVGSSFVDDFRGELISGSLDASGLQRTLEMWSTYDAAAGFGKFDFSDVRDGIVGCKTVYLRNPFLADRKLGGERCLCSWVEGYVEGCLESITNAEFEVHKRCTTPTHRVCEFLVSPAPPRWEGRHSEPGGQ